MPNLGMKSNFGIKRMSLREHLDNTNLLEDQSDTSKLDQPFTLNSIRTGKAFRGNLDQHNPYGGPGTPGEERVPNQPSPVATSGPVPTNTDNSASNLENIASIAQSIYGKPSVTLGEETIPGQQPGKDFNMAAVNAPEARNIETKPKFDADKLAKVAGAFGAAIAPRNSWQSRLGATASALASENIKKREEAPEKALAQKLLKAKIADLEKGDTPKTAMSWYLSSNPGAKEKDVAAFKKSLDAETKGSYWRTVGDDGTVSIYKGADLINKSEPGVGKTKATETMVKTEEGYVPASKAEGKMPYSEKKTPAPVTWTTATKELKGRFGKMDANNNIIMTPEGQKSHAIAQKKLVELKKIGNIEPLDAINIANDFARHIEDRYWQYLDKAKTSDGLSSKQREEYSAKAKKAFKAKYGYVPRIQR